MTHAEFVIDHAKKELMSFIKFEIGMIDTAVNATEKNKTEEEDWVWNPAINVPVDNSYLDIEDYCTERRKVVTIAIEKIDDDEKVIIYTEEGDEIFAERLSVEELGGISDCLQESYKHLVKE